MLWAKCFGLATVLLLVTGAIVGGGTSAVFFVAAVGCLLVVGACLRGTGWSGDSGGGGF
jgi:hypothetical protein